MAGEPILSYPSGMLGCVTALKLREWRGVKPVAGPSGVAISTRLRTTPEEERVLDLVAGHLGGLRRADLARVCHPVPFDRNLDAVATRQARRDRLNTRKKALTAESSARWASAMIAANDAQYRLARDAQYRYIRSLRAAIATIEKRLAHPTADTGTPEQRKACKTAKLPKGYATQAERFQKQRRLQVLRAELGRVCTDWDDRVVNVVEGAKRLAKTRHHLDAANLTLSEWRDTWNVARYRIEALGSGDEPFGNLTLTVTADGEVSLRLPRPLEHLANAKHGRYVLSGIAVFSYRAEVAGPRHRPQARVVHDYPSTRPVRALPHRLMGMPANDFRTSLLAGPKHRSPCGRPGSGCGSQRRPPRRAPPRWARQPGRPARAHRGRPHGKFYASGCAGSARDHPAPPLHLRPRHRQRGGGGPRLR